MHVSARLRCILQCLLIAFITLLQGCNDAFKLKEDIPDGDASPIDGIWRTDKTVTERYRIEKGKMYCLSSPMLAYGRVLVLNIKRERPREYSCLNGAFLNDKGDKPDCLLEVIGSEEILVRLYTESANKKGGKSVTVDMVFKVESLDNEPWFSRDLREGRGADIDQSAVKVTVNPKTKRVEASSEEVVIPVGVVLKIRRSRTVEHKLSFELGSESQATIEAKLLPLVEGSIRAELSASLGREFKTSETVDHEIVLDGNRATRYRLVWYDKWRTGSALLGTAEKNQSIPFRFREWEDLEIVALPN